MAIERHTERQPRERDVYARLPPREEEGDWADGRVPHTQPGAPVEGVPPAAERWLHPLTVPPPLPPAVVLALPPAAPPASPRAPRAWHTPPPAARRSAPGRREAPLLRDPLIEKFRNNVLIEISISLIGSASSIKFHIQLGLQLGPIRATWLIEAAN